jgi:hypothetical protein
MVELKLVGDRKILGSRFACPRMTPVDVGALVERQRA